MARRSRPDLALLAIVAVGAFLRLYRLGEAPTPISDEFVHLDLATNLLSGDPRVGPFRVDWFASIFHPPLFFVLAALSVALFGESIVALRLVPALAGTATIALLYFAGCRLRGRSFGLVAAAAYAALPTAVMLDRWGYSYPLALPLTLAALVGALRFRQQGDRVGLYLAALAISALLVTGYYAAPLLAVFLLFVAVHDRRRLAPAAAIALSLPALFFALCVLPRWGPATFTLAWQLEHATAWPFDLGTHLRANLALVSTDGFLGVAALGLLLAFRGGGGWIVLGIFALSQYMIYRRPDIAIVLYPSAAFLGLFALGFAHFFHEVRDVGLLATARWLEGRPRARRAWSTIAIGTPLALAGIRLATEIGPVVLGAQLVSPSEDAADRPERVAATRAYLARHAAPGDLVIGSPAFTVGLPLRLADLMQTYVYETGKGTASYPAYLPERPDYRTEFFRYDCSLERADWLVLSRNDWSWRLQQRHAQRVLGTTSERVRSEFRADSRRGELPTLTLRGERWHTVHRAGEILLLRAPRGPGAPQSRFRPAPDSARARRR